MRFNLNDLKVLEEKLRSKNVKGDFLTQSNLGMSNPFRLKSGLNADISHANHILLNCYQGALLY